MTEDFHTYTAKALFLCKCGRPDIQTAVAFLTMQVKEPDTDDWKKLLRLMANLRGTKNLILTIEADNMKMMKFKILKTLVGCFTDGVNVIARCFHLWQFIIEKMNFHKMKLHLFDSTGFSTTYFSFTVLITTRY